LNNVLHFLKAGIISCHLQAFTDGQGGKNTGAESTRKAFYCRATV